MDLKEYDVVSAAEQGAELVLRDPSTGDKLDASITVLGSDSETYRAAQTRENDKLLRMRKAGEKVESEMWRDVASTVLAKCTIGWKNITESGKPLECNEKNALHVYRAYPWIREQVDKFISERTNFLSGRSSS